jgi:hypothetical protein
VAIVSCHVCGRNLRVPDGKRGKVACPCGAEWFHPDTIELSDIEFRCSMSGARFNVISSRRSPLHKFVIQQIKKAVSAETGRPTAEPTHSEQSARQTVTTNARLPGPGRVGGWLARIVGRKVDVVPSVPPISVQGQIDELSLARTQDVTHDADEYNWAGFSCPYCGASSFVSCGGGHLACDGTAEVRNGRRFHTCFCGAAGFITGSIKGFEGKRLSVEAPPDAPKVPTEANRKPADIALPTPTKGGSPAKR